MSAADYDAEGNYIGAAAAEAKPAPKPRRRRRKAAAAAARDDSEDSDPTSGPSPFADVAIPVVTAAAAAPEKAVVLEEVDEDRLPDQPQAAAGTRQQVDKDKQLALERQKLDNQKKIEEMHAALDKAQRAAKKRQRERPNPMGHFSHPASDDHGFVNDGIYFWTNMGLGKMPLKVTKQWRLDDDRGCATPDARRARKNLRLPHE
eukprot:TRINITY_DN34113_c0_g1_i1.p2 TRINITY_DN34113_c0_g1~~TRINITY_DN34113_c0_g1_i1.p2  ORF type:complete len:204 (+),score=79.96 TRINITY_DN34113_c0_g1_i1:73-684(+)